MSFSTQSRCAQWCWACSRAPNTERVLPHQGHNRCPQGPPWPHLIKQARPVLPAFPQLSEFAVFQATLTPTLGDEEARAPSLSGQWFPSPTHYLHGGHVPESLRNGKNNSLAIKQGHLRFLTLFSLFLGTLSRGLWQGQMICLFSLNFIAWANLEMCIHLPFITLHITTLV